MAKFLIGVDEVGRGPLAGPVVVCAVLMLRQQLRKFTGVKDSKKLSEEQRLGWHARSRELSVQYKVCFVSHSTIDKIGIVPAVRRAVFRSVRALGIDPEACEVLLDGGLKAPPEFVFQRTIIRGDSTEPVISLASVLAKVARDRRMVRLAKKYPAYGFEKHKGYGTRAHYEAIKMYGLSEIHRRSFCKKFSVS